MKVVNVNHGHPTIDEVIALAKDELVVLRGSDGTSFAVAQVDDFDLEVELLKNNREFMAFLDERAKEPGVISLKDLRAELGLLAAEREN